MIDDQNVNISLYTVQDFEASDWQSEPWLKARLADLLWLRHRGKAGVAVGVMAIDAYMEQPVTKEAFSGEGGLYWLRALHLTRMLKKLQEIGKKASTI